VGQTDSGQRRKPGVFTDATNGSQLLQTHLRSSAECRRTHSATSETRRRTGVNEPFTDVSGPNRVLQHDPDRQGRPCPACDRLPGLTPLDGACRSMTTPSYFDLKKPESLDQCDDGG
jgi:hypothetical protein